MGIKGLLQFLQGIAVDTHLRHYAGKTIDVDVSCYLYKGAFGCAEGPKLESCLRNNTS